jgi:hypothetical protein
VEQIDLSVPASIYVVRETPTPDQVGARDVSWTYLNDEFPSQRPYVYSTVTHSLARFFVSFLPQDKRIRDVMWAFERPVLRIWTIIDEPDFQLEQPIYEAQRRFMDKLDDVPCDFSVVYAFGKPIEEIRPTGAVSLK